MSLALPSLRYGARVLGFSRAHGIAVGTRAAMCPAVAAHGAVTRGRKRLISFANWSRLIAADRAHSKAIYVSVIGEHTGRGRE
jgi:hypothetical protein